MSENLTDKIGQRYICPVSDLRQIGCPERIHLKDEVPILYRWWFPGDSPVMTYLREYVTEHPSDFQMKYMLEHTLQQIEIDGRIYYALYFGQSRNSKTRILDNHLNGPIKNSTLRATIRAILALTHKTAVVEKEEINKVLDDCYLEWAEFIGEDAKLLDIFEIAAITVGHYPLNLDGNPSASAEWISLITAKRSELKDY